jgi:hypothetical protein
MSAPGDSSADRHATAGEKQDRRLLFLRELADENATIAGDITELASDIWAVHGAIPVDGEVIMAEFDTYDQARGALDSLAGEGPSVAPS